MNSIKDLIYKSAELIDKGWEVLGNTNMSYCPVILVYVGETAHYNRGAIIKTLKNNWRNGSYIEEILIPLDYTGNDAVLLENVDYEQDKEHEVMGSISELIDICIRKRILKTPNGVFADKKRIFVEFISTCEDIGDFSLIEDILRPIDTLMGIDVWKSLYLMIDQSEPEYDRRAREFINEMERNRDLIFSDNGFRQIYILSNFLCDGTILDEDEIGRNYRAVGDVLLLKNNYNINLGTKSSFFEKFNQAGVVRTVSYNLVEKPCREIAVAAYMGIISEILSVKVREDLYKGFTTTEFTFFDDYFRTNLEQNLPGAADMEYLAWEPKEFERLSKIGSVSPAQIDNATMGQWSEFINMYYSDAVKEKTETNEFRMGFHNYLKSRFNYREMRECFMKDEVRGAVARVGTQATAYERGTLFEKTAVYGREHARSLYYEKYAVPVYESTLNTLYDEADDFEHMVRVIDSYLPRASAIISSKLYSSIGEYYGRIVRDYIREHQTEFYALMDVDLSKNDFYDKLYEFFKSMTGKLDVFGLNFEQELSRRLEGMGSDFAKRNKIIEEALVSDIEGRCRLNVAMGANCRQIHQSYLGNPRADFVKRLMGDKINNVYDLEKSDCIENLVIYQIDSLSDIFGGAQ